MLVPPDNFGLVEEGIYRCARLDPLNFAFLETLNLKSLVLLDGEKPPRALLNFFEDKSTSIHHIVRSSLKVIENQEEPEADVLQAIHDAGGTTPSSISGYDKMEDWMIIRPNLIAEIFKLVFNKSKHNMMIVDKTEALVGLLRKLQKWSFSSIINEYRLYAANRSTYSTETFLELLRIELVSFEENELKKKDEEQESKRNQASKEGVKISALRNSFSTRSSISSISKSIEDLKVDDLEDLNFEQLQSEKLSLSASPQIPHELLKLAKQRKLKKNILKDDPETQEEINRSFSDDLLNARDKSLTYYAYYKSYDTQFDNLTNQGQKKGRIKIILPQEENLPLWFKRQRDSWEEIYKQNKNL